MDNKKPHVPIAICGYGYRLPGGLENEDDFWSLMATRGYVQELIGNRYGASETPWDSEFAANSPSFCASPFEGLIKDRRELEFDCEAFGMAKSEAKRMDPQIKMMLSCTWDALQCAGMDQAALHNSNTGVFIGQQASAVVTWKHPFGADPADIPGRSAAMIANRISFHFNWMGPSYSVATACSSGITAMDNAVKALDRRDCDMATFGAVQYLGNRGTSVSFNQLGIISKTGESRSFDKDANGYMRSEGAFIFILKRLDDAERCGDKIFGVVRGCGLNTAGSEAGAETMTQGRMILSPVAHAQESLMRSVVQMAGIDPHQVDYVEAHATGTKVGDSTEGNSISQVYGSSSRSCRLRLASVRSNVGHLEAASFTSSLLKVLVMLKKKEFLPISSHFKKQNPNIPFKEKRMVVQTTCEPFPQNRDEPVSIAINSFGFGGANGHCIIQEYRSRKANIWSKLPGNVDVKSKYYTLPLSAKSEGALIENARELLRYLEEGRFNECSDDMSDHNEETTTLYLLASNLSVRMTNFRIRTAITANTIKDLCANLSNFVDNARESAGEINGAHHVDSSSSKRVVVVFPGQGSQWAGCGRELYRSEIVFRRVIDEVDSIWEQLSGGNKLSDMAFNIGDSSKVSLNKCRWAQPVTFLIQVGLWEMLKMHMIVPSAVLGHSAGEVAAAYASGAYTLAEACTIVYHRSLLQETLSGCGRMLVLMQSCEAVKDLLIRYNKSQEIYIACINSYNNTVVCGSNEAIISLQEMLLSDGLPGGKMIPGNIAFHSRFMDPIKGPIFERLQDEDGTNGRECNIPMISTVTGGLVKTLDTNYWWQNIRQPVDFLAALKTAKNTIKADSYIELSPHITLRSPTREFYSHDDITFPPYIHSLIRSEDSSKKFAEMIGGCFKVGMTLNFQELYPRPKPVTHLFPPYAMKREEVIDQLMSPEVAISPHGDFGAGPLLGSYDQGGGLQFSTTISKGHYRWLADHVVQGVAILPASGYVELLIEAFKGEAIKLGVIHFHAPLVISPEAKHLHTNIQPVPSTSNCFEFKITTRPHASSDTKSTLHCSGTLETISSTICIPNDIPKNVADENVDYSTVQHASCKSFYESMVARSDNCVYGPCFQCIKRVDRDVKTQKLRLEIAMDKDFWLASEKMGYFLHPVLLDGGLQSLLTYSMEAPDFMVVPRAMNNFVYLGKKPSCGQITCLYEPPSQLKEGTLGQLNFGHGETSVGRVFLYDGISGDLIAFMQDYTGFFSNNRRSDLCHVKHNLSWQPKDVINAPDLSSSAIEAMRNGKSTADVMKILITEMSCNGHPRADIPLFLNVGECHVGSMPDSLILKDSVSFLSQMPVQYSVLAPHKSFLQAMYQQLSARNTGAHLQFIDSTADFDSGFLRPSMFEILFISATVDTSDCEKDLENKIHCLAKLVAPGGILALEVSGCDIILPPAFSCLHNSSQLKFAQVGDSTQSKMMVLRSPLTDVLLEDVCVEDKMEMSPYIIVDDDEGYSRHWRVLHKQEKPADEDAVNFACSRDWKEVHYFAMTSHNSSDTDFHSAPLKLTRWIQKLAAHRGGLDGTEMCTFTVYTCGAVNNVTSPEQTGVWGAIRTMALELGETCSIDFRLIDLACPDDLKFVPVVMPMRERELCIHNGRVWASRLLNKREAEPCVQLSWDGNQAIILETNKSGTLSDIQFRTCELPELGPNDIKIAVKASALNFRDIMVGLGRLPPESYKHSALGQNLGIECAGVVAQCGSSVTNHEVGNRVIVMKGGCIANQIVVNEKFAWKVPNNMSFEEGASVLSVYVTAYYSLVHLGRVRKGQTVLVHSAMGGVGQAAIALAKFKGAYVYGTAGSESKRTALREMGCLDAFDSHSTEWFRALMESTKGVGVDMVLNSLAGEHIDLCLEAIKPGGYHFEIGKVDIFSNRPLKMSVFQKNLCFRGVDIDRLIQDDPELATEQSKQCLELLETGKVPAIPIMKYSYAEHVKAFQCMMNGKHRGKIVMSPSEKHKTISVIDNRPLFDVGSDGLPRSVLITGGYGGFGLRLLSYVISRGASQVIMLDRDKQLRRSAEWIRDASYSTLLFGDEKKVRIETLYADVSKYEDVVNVFSEIKGLGMHPIGSIFHLAGVVDDKNALEMDSKSFETVYRPKANGAWNLHLATADMESLGHFVLLSSISSSFGAPGQVNYSSASSFLDGLADMRRQNGLPALSFCMGAVNGAGMASKDPQLLRMMKSRGLPAISFIFAFNALDSALRSCRHSNSVAAYTSKLWSTHLGSPDFLRIAQLSRFSSSSEFEESGTITKESVICRLSERIGDLCGVDNVAPTEPFSTYGLNSISVAEFLAFLKKDFSYSITPLELMTSATCETIAIGVLGCKKGDAIVSADEKEAEEEETRACVSHLNRNTEAKRSRFAPALQEYFKKDSLLMMEDEDLDGKHMGGILSTPRTISDPMTSTSRNDESVLDQMHHLLPSDCRETLDDIIHYTDDLDVRDLDQAVPANEIRQVLVTGATGFLGRHFVADLLQQEQIKMIYCPVRAENDEEAFSRLIQSMGEAGLWKDSYHNRLTVFRSNLEEEYLGISMDLYGEVVSVTDAVFHFACNISLSASFKDIGAANCLPMKAVLRLCMSSRRKHLFHASTLGIFPQYTCRFANEMLHETIEADGMPNITLMKRHFPPILFGYPWSKLINELAVRHVSQEKDIPHAIFRLPLMVTNSSTGYTVQSDPLLRTLFAMMQTGLCPTGTTEILMEDSDPVNKIMLEISLNPRRQHNIYHCVSNVAGLWTESPEFGMLGFDVRAVPYDAFKARCLQLGSESPLHRYFPLLDHFEEYWFTDEKNRLKRDQFPIDTSTVVADCPNMPNVTDIAVVMRKGTEWVFNHKNTWPFDVTWLIPSLDAEILVSPVKKLCARYNEDFNEVVPPFVLEGLHRICRELHATGAMLPAIAYLITSVLENRLHLYRTLKMHPEIKDVPIEDPVFILGLNRTGTTFLHRLLEASGALAAPYFEDQFCLLPAEKVAKPTQYDLEAQATSVESMLNYFIHEGVGEAHDMTLGIPEEDMFAHLSSFHCDFWNIVHHLPMYRSWLDSQPMNEVYLEHRRWMQYTVWSRQRGGNAPDTQKWQRWCFKLPWHARSLEALYQVYPDSRIIHTHRRPTDVVGSWCSLVEHIRTRNQYSVDRQRLGEEQVAFMEETLDRVRMFRMEHPELEDSWLDVKYSDLVSTPDKVAIDVLTNLGISLNQSMLRNIAKYLSENRSKPTGRTKHINNIHDYGLSEESIESSDIFSLETSLYCAPGI